MSFSKSTLANASALVGLLAVLLIAPTTVGAPPSHDAQRIKDANDRAARERLRKVEQQRKDEQWRRDWQERQQKDAQERAQREAQQQAGQFNASKAPPPGDCLKYFILAASSATSMEQLMKYLPESEQKMLREKQVNFESQPASASPMEDQPFSVTPSPYEAALQGSKNFARQVTDILDVKVMGDQAELTVATCYMVNGRPVPDGKASVEMVGEGSSWRVKTGGASPLIRKQAPSSP